MAEKLSITIFLDGAAEIERQLEGIGQAGTKAFTEIGAAAEKAGGFDKLDPKDVTAKLEQFGVKGKAAIDKITAAVAQAGRLERIVGGVRQVEAGFASIGVAAGAMSQRVGAAVTAAAAGMSTLVAGASRVARSFGLIGRLGTGGLVVGLGASVVGMEKAADAARILEGNLQALFRSQSGGTAFFNQIQQAAQNAGSSLESTAQTMTAIVKELQKAFAAKGFRFAPGEGLKQSADIAAQAFDTLQKGMQLSGARADDAAKAIKALFAEISKNQPTAGDTFEQASQKAKAMADVLRKLAAEFPQLANELVKFLGTPGQTMDQLADQVEKGIRKIDIPKFLNALTRARPEIEKLREAFDPTLGQRMDAISGAWDRLLNSFGKSPAGAAIKGVLDDIAKGLDEIAKKQEQIGKFTVEKPPETTTGKFLDQIFKEFDQNVKIAETNWKRLTSLLASPVDIGWLLLKLNPVGLVITNLIRQLNKLREALGLKPIDIEVNTKGLDELKAKAQDLLKTTFDTFKNTKIGPEAQAAINELTAALSDATPNADRLAAAIKGVEEAAKAAGKQGAESAKTLSKLTIREAPKAGEVTEGPLAKRMRESQAEIAKVKASMDELVAAEARAAETAKLIHDNLAQTEESALDISKIKLPEIKIEPEVKTEGIFEKFQALWEKIKELFKGGLISPAGAAEAAPGGTGAGGGAEAQAAPFQRILALITEIKTALQAGFTIPPIDTTVFDAVTTAIQSAKSAAEQFASALGSITWDAVSDGAAAWAAIVSAIQNAQSTVQQFASSLSSITWDAVSAGATAWNAVTQSIREATNALAQYNAAAASSGFAGGGPVGFQGGGLLGGRGTGTSDSNLVRVSRGEYIVPARAVRAPGVLAFLEALRHSGGRLQDIVDDMGRFALGGLVPRAIPAFASGGLAGGGMSNVTIQFPGLPPIEGLRASEKVIDELRKTAALAQVRSGGRKPSRYT